MNSLIHIIKYFEDNQTVANVTNSAVLKMAKYELRHLNRLSNEIFTDAQATKLFYSSKCLNKSNTGFAGFLHDIRQDKFGLLFYSEKQVKTYFFARRRSN